MSAANLAGLITSLAGPVVKKALTAIGVGVVTYAGLQVAVNQAIGAAQGAFGGMGGDIAALAAMGGIFTALSIIAGGITAGISMIAMKRLALLTG